jgi:MoaA/NifB/PqqE/SkfB family radical SAM enzyme
MKKEELLGQLSSKKLFEFLLGQRFVRKKILNLLEERSYKAIVENNPDNRPKRVQEVKYNYMMALLQGVMRGLDKGFISRKVTKRVLQVFFEHVLLEHEHTKEEVVKKLGFSPPLFVVISPTGKCNLRCKGCYAASDNTNHASLSYDVFNRIIKEQQDLWNSHFTVISGGEPFLWKDGDFTFLDMVAEHSSQFFMVYTNGTLITEDVAKRIAELGNITPAISVEGFEKETDWRRGKGVFKKVLKAFENLRKYGAPFGISITPHNNNWQTIISDEFRDFYFHQQGVVYAWLFQYMPVGRAPTLDMMVPPENRVKMFHKMMHRVRDERIFMADFWNSGMASSGCISAGRPGGYFYIDWDGDITPCVFIPYAVDNIHDVYARGQTLSDVLQAPFLKKIRAWQDDYGYKQAPDKVDNWLCPCIIRDHYDVFKNLVQETKARPINKEAEIALNDANYQEGLTGYGKEIYGLTNPIWQSQYSGKTEKAVNNKSNISEH